jgi:hypothetical protein
MRKRNYSPHRGTLTRFDRRFYSPAARFTYIGSGELGGKAHGLARAKGILDSSFREAFAPAVEVSIPVLTVVTTDLFDLFMKENDLFEAAYSGGRDDLIAHAFQRASLPVQLVGDLRALVEQVRAPLAIRSSSLLEDAMFEPFASVYATKMVPNNQPDADTRFRKLVEAIKFVYASTFFRSARNYMKATHHATLDEKMAVIVQEVVGARFGDRFYPHVSGVLRSYNFYPVGYAKPGEGVVELALGLGRTIVDDGVSWSFSPSYPKIDPPFKSIRDMLKHTQTRLWAVNMGKPPAFDPINETEYLVRCGVDEAEYDGSIRHLASTYIAADDVVEMGIEARGPRIIDFSPILKANALPLAELLRSLKETCEDMLGAMVEVEFAMTLDRERCAPASFGFLQVRPMVVSTAAVDLDETELAGERVLLSSETVLGNGVLDSIRDIVYVDPERFDVLKSREIAAEIERLNGPLIEARRPYLLIGFGRWGTTDPLGGIPVDFGQISGAAAIVEASLPNLPFTLSQGSHFFHNVTSFKILYFSIRHHDERNIDWDWLRRRERRWDGAFASRLELDAPLLVKVDGRSGRGVILHD